MTPLEGSRYPTRMQDIRVASVQFTHVNENPSMNLEVVRRYITLAAEQGVAILVFPEMCLTGYWGLRDLPRERLEALSETVPDGPVCQEILELSERLNMTIGVGLIERDSSGDLFNAYFVAMPDGSHACHRKLHTFISPHMRSGDSYTVFDTPHGCRVGVLTCYDNNIGENVRITALKGAEILLAPHQTGGCDTPSPRCMGAIDVELWENREKDPESIEAEFLGRKGREWLVRWLPARAHDNGLFLVYSNGVGRDDNEVRTGNSMILDCYGAIIAETNRAGEAMVVADLKADLMKMCTGRRWIRSRRPELYQPLVEPTGKEQDIRTVRFSRQGE